PLAPALRGERRLVFIPRNPGTVKTALVQALLDELDRTSGPLVGHGQCLEHFGASEAYMPVLDAFTRLGQTRHGLTVVDVLRRYAPSWLTQMPSLLPDAERVAFHTQEFG